MAPGMLSFEEVGKACDAIAATGISADECAEAMSRLANVMREIFAKRYIKGFMKHRAYHAPIVPGNNCTGRTSYMKDRRPHLYHCRNNC